MSGQRYDGLQLVKPGDCSLWRVFEPRWWQLHRWIGWWWRAKVRRGMTGTIQLGPKKLRVERVPCMLVHHLGGRDGA